MHDILDQMIKYNVAEDDPGGVPYIDGPNFDNTDHTRPFNFDVNTVSEHNPPVNSPILDLNRKDNNRVFHPVWSRAMWSTERFKQYYGMGRAAAALTVPDEDPTKPAQIPQCERPNPTGGKKTGFQSVAKNKPKRKNPFTAKK